MVNSAQCRFYRTFLELALIPSSDIWLLLCRQI